MHGAHADEEAERSRGDGEERVEQHGESQSNLRPFVLGDKPVPYANVPAGLAPPAGRRDSCHGCACGSDL